MAEQHDLVVRRFRAMGSPARIVTDRADVADAAQLRIHDLEQRWSRFLETSEVSGANRNAGYPTVVSPETLELFARAHYASERTGGIFNPLLLDHLVALGYDRTFAAVQPSSSDDLPAFASGSLLIAESAGAVTVPEGAGFDPGGLGKGLAGDIATREAIALGAETFLVELGGDLRVAGSPWYGDDQWTVDIGHADGHIGTVHIREGGVATSSTRRQCWQHNGTTVHHVLDGRTGRPAFTEASGASVVAADLWWAEVAATCALVVPAADRDELFADLGVTGLTSHEVPA